MRFCRVSGRLARTSVESINFRADLLWLRKQSFVPGCFENAASKSGGTMSSSTSSKMVHEPFCLATSMHFIPASVIKLCSSSLTIFSLLIFDQVLCCFRLVKY